MNKGLPKSRLFAPKMRKSLLLDHLKTVVSLDDLFDKKLIPSQYYEQEILRCFKDYLRIFLRYDLEMPVYIFLSFVNVKGYVLMVVNSNPFGGKDLDRQDIILPEKVLTEYETDAIEVLRPMFDLIWNAFGYKRSFNFDENGQWIKV